VTAPATLPRSGTRGQDASVTKRAGPTTWVLAAVSLILAATTMGSRYLFSDTFYDLYAGRWIVQHGLPHSNLLTVTAHGAPWVDQQWLAQVSYYGAWSAGGYRLLAGVSAALVASGFALLALLMLRRGVPPARAFAWTLLAFAVLGTAGIRAQSFAYPCIALTLWLITADSQSARPRARVWLVIPVLIFWANTHGSVLLGAAMVGFYSIYRAVIAIMRGHRTWSLRYLLLAAMSAASVVCTPYGVGVLGYYAQFPGDPPLGRYLPEWAPPSPLSRFSWAFFAALLVIIVAVVLAWRRGARPDPVLGGAAVLLLALAFVAVRNQAWFGFGGTLAAAEVTARASGGKVPALSAIFSRTVAGTLGSLAVASLIALAVTPDSQFFSQVPRRAVSVAADLAAEHPRLRLLGDDYTSGALLWLRPAVLGRVGFDARFELYGAQIEAFSDFLFIRGPAWAEVTRRYGLIVVSNQHAGLVKRLSTLRGWRVAYQDARGIVLLRRKSVPSGS
jgi:hypothetical protein